MPLTLVFTPITPINLLVAFRFFFLLQYFYREYYWKTKDRLEEFDRVFGESLKNEKEKLERVY